MRAPPPCCPPQALALHLIEGTIDEVAGTVSVTWVAPRILTKPQLSGLKLRLDTWIDKVGRAGGLARGPQHGALARACQGGGAKV